MTDRWQATDLRSEQLRLVARPSGLPGPECWSLASEAVRPPSDGEVLVEIAYLSVDPGLRGWISEGGSYVDAVPLGSIMRAFGVGTVVASASDEVPVGAVVTGEFGVQEWTALSATEVTVHSQTDSLPRLLGAFGTSGVTAYLGILEAAAAQPGDTVVVSGAAGSVGSLAGQIARVHGCRVIGIAGGPSKCKWILELGFDAAIDYKSQDVGVELKRIAPNGVDVYFDNVGGAMLDQVLERIAVGARIVLSGTLAQWEPDGWAGLRNHRMLLIRRARMQGFLVFDYLDRYEEARSAMAEWIDAGLITAREEIVDGGVEAFAGAFRGLFTGENTGKRVVRVAGGSTQ